MTEKRFTLDSEENGLCKCILMNGEEIPTCEVVKLLNELNDECDFFEIENESLEHSATKYAELYHKSLKENEQLKARIQLLSTLLDNADTIIDLSNDELAKAFWRKRNNEVEQEYKMKYQKGV